MRQILFVCLLFSGNVFAQAGFKFDEKLGKAVPTYIAEVELLRGSVTRKRKGQSRVTHLEVGEKIYLGDLVNAGNNSFARIRMVDDSMITIGAKSDLRFDEFSFRSKTDREGLMNLIRGRMRVEVKNKAPNPDAIRARVGQVVMGVRGTIFLANRRLLPGGIETTQVALLEGSGMIENEVSKKKIILRPKDHYVAIQKNGELQGKDYVAPLDGGHFSELTNNEIDLKNKINPLLYFVDTKSLSKAKKKSAKTPKRSPDSVGGVEKEATPSSGSDWRKTLEKLNEAIQEREDTF